MAFGPITSWEIDGETMETVTDFYFGGFQNHWDGWMASPTRWMLSLSEPWEMVMYREAWRAVIHGVAKNRTQLRNWTELNWKSLQMVTAAMKLEDASWEESYDKPRQHIKKERHHLTDKCPYSQSYGFSSSHVWMWELDYNELWVPKNWCFWTVVLEKTLEESLGLQGDPTSPS